MQTIRASLLAVVAIAVVAGFSGWAQAQSPQSSQIHMMTVRLPGGGVEEIRYAGNTPPQVAVETVPQVAPVRSLFGAGSPFAEFDRIAAEMDRQATALLQQTASLDPAALARMRAGSGDYTYVSTLTGNGYCAWEHGDHLDRQRATQGCDPFLRQLRTGRRLRVGCRLARCPADRPSAGDDHDQGPRDASAAAPARHGHDQGRRRAVLRADGQGDTCLGSVSCPNRHCARSEAISRPRASAHRDCRVAPSRFPGSLRSAPWRRASQSFLPSESSWLRSASICASMRLRRGSSGSCAGRGGGAAAGLAPAAVGRQHLQRLLEQRHVLLAHLLELAEREDAEGRAQIVAHLLLVAGERRPSPARDSPAPETACCRRRTRSTGAES